MPAPPQITGAHVRWDVSVNFFILSFKDTVTSVGLGVLQEILNYITNKALPLKYPSKQLPGALGDKSIEVKKLVKFSW